MLCQRKGELSSSHICSVVIDSDTRAEFDLKSQEDKNYNLFSDAASRL